MPKPQLYDATFKMVRETDKAICVTEDDENNIWLPKSQIEYTELESGLVEVTMPLWLASEKDLL